MPDERTLEPSPTEEGRYRIRKPMVEWDFTREQLVARLAALREEATRLQGYLDDIDGGRVMVAERTR